MTTIDQAFIRAFGQQDAGPAAAPQPASASQASDPPAEQLNDEAADVGDDSPGRETAEGAAKVCSCSVDGTSSSGSDGACLSRNCGWGLPVPADRTEPEAPPEKPLEPTSQGPSGRGIGAGPSGDDPPEVGAIGPDDERFQPSFQVDSFAWPSGCTRLSMVAGEQIDQLADSLAGGLEQGHQVVAMSGCRRGDGCTTLLLCVARRLAERGLRIAMIDADFDNPLVARRLGLLPEVGWEEIFTARLPVEEVTIESVQDRLAVLPLCGSLPCRACPAEDLPDPASALNVLREHYDLVLVDLGQLGDDTLNGDGASRAVMDWIDAMVLVHDVRGTSQDELNRTRRRVQAAGLVEAGIAENFVEVRKSA